MAKVQNIIYISSHNIQMIKGSSDKKDMIKIFDFDSYELQEGSMINGVIIDDQDVLDGLKYMKEKGVKSTRLVIDSGQILVKNAIVPIVSKNDLLKIIKDEFSDVEGNYEDLIYDYGVLNSSIKNEDSTTAEILCCGIDRKLLESYLEIFEKSGITLKSIDLSAATVHKITQELAEFENKTYIISIMDGNNVSSYLFENNHYSFSKRTRFFSERGTEAFVSEMNSNISQLIQFNKAKHSSYAIDAVYFCGLIETEKVDLLRSIQLNLDINAAIFPNTNIVSASSINGKEFILHEYLFAVGCLLRK